jgi:hypothetical protein
MGMLKEEAKTLEAEAKSRGRDTTKAESPRRLPHHHQGVSPRASNSRRKPS